MEKEHHGFLYGMVAALTSALTALFVKLSGSVSVPMLVFFRFAVGVPVVLWMMHRQKMHLSLEKVPKNLTRSLAALLSLYSFFYALQSLPLVNALTLSNTTPLFFPFLALFWLKLIVSHRRFWAAGLGFLGVVILLNPTAGKFLATGSFFGLASGFLGAVALMSVRLLSKTENTETILSYYYLLGAILSFFPMIFYWEPVTDPLQWLYVCIAAVCGMIYQFTMTKAYSHAPATKVGTTNYLGVVFGGLFGWAVFDEVPHWWVIAGIVFIIGGALIALFDRTVPRSIK